MTARPTSVLRVLISADQKSVMMRLDKWRMTCPVGDLPKWLELHRHFVRTKPSVARFYDQGVTAIANAMQRLGMDISEPAEKKGKR